MIEPHLPHARWRRAAMAAKREVGSDTPTAIRDVSTVLVEMFDSHIEQVNFARPDLFGRRYPKFVPFLAGRCRLGAGDGLADFGFDGFLALKSGTDDDPQDFFDGIVYWGSPPLLMPQAKEEPEPSKARRLNGPKSFDDGQPDINAFAHCPETRESKQFENGEAFFEAPGRLPCQWPCELR